MHVKSFRDLIYWQYAKIISESAGAGKRQYGFVMDRFKKLVSGEISWSTSIREYVKEREKAETEDNLQPAISLVVEMPLRKVIKTYKTEKK